MIWLKLLLRNTFAVDTQEEWLQKAGPLPVFLCSDDNYEQNVNLPTFLLRLFIQNNRFFFR